MKEKPTSNNPAQSAEQNARTAWTFRSTLVHLWPYMKPYRKQFQWGLLSILATNAVGVIEPWILKYAIEDLKPEITAAKITFYASLIVLVALVAGIFRYLMRRIIVSISRYIEFDMRTQYFQHLQRLSPSFYDHQQTGDLMTRATSDIEAVRMIVGPAVMYSLDTFLTAVFVISLMFALSVPLTLWILGLAPILSVSIYFLAKKIHIYSLESQERYSELNAMIQEHLSGIRVLRAYCQEEPERRLFADLNGRYIDASMKLVKLQAMLIPFFYSTFGLGMAIVLYIGGRAIILQQMSLGDFVAYSAYVAMLAWPVMAVGWVINLFQRGSASLQRIQKILNVQSEILDDSSDQSILQLNGHIAFEHLCFTFPQTSSPVLENLNLEIPAGTSLGIVGAIGSGKSSLVNLIPRLYPVSSGALLLDGVPIERIPLEVLRRQVAVVPQDSFLFSDRLDRNLLFANFEFGRAQLLQVAEASGLSSDLENFPEGIETWVGERGLTLSGGQKQRASLARALAADPKIIILDDSFSAVDTRTEAEILGNIRPLLRGKTIIIIAHRISTLNWADQIIFLEAGRIVEKGTHEELLALGGRYARLFQQQLLEEELREAV